MLSFVTEEFKIRYNSENNTKGFVVWGVKVRWQQLLIQ